VIEPSSNVQPPAVVGLAAALQGLNQMLLGGRTLIEVLYEVCRLAVASLPEVDQASITLVKDDRTRTAAFSGALAATLDERQFADGFGPCLDAALFGGVIRIDTTAADDLYSDFAAVAARQGVTSVLALALPMPVRVLGALNLYRLHATRPFSTETETAAAAFGAYAAVALANAAPLVNRKRMVTHLQASITSRAFIDQAKGIS